MDEIDTKPAEPIRNALPLFGEKGNQKKHQHRTNKRNCEEELEGLSMDMSNCKLQMEAKPTAYMQALLKVEHYRKLTSELSTLLKKSDTERNKNINTEGKARTDGLESMMKEKEDQHFENAKVRKQLSEVLIELKDTQRQLLNKETELVAARDSELKALTKAEDIEIAFKNEKEKREQLLQQVLELNEAFPLKKPILVDSLQLEVKQAKEANSSSEKSASNARNDSNQFHTDMEQKERKSMGRSVYIEALEMELNQLKLELRNAKKEANGLNSNIESLTGELMKAKAEMNKIKSREIEAQVETALLTSQLHEGTLTFGGVEAAEDGEKRVESVMYQQLSKKAQNHQSNPEAEEINNEKDNNDHITIPLREYESLIRKVEKANEVQASVVEVGSQSEPALLKMELEAVSLKIEELRARAEQALIRAELAEKAKEALEDKLKRQREKRQRKRAALAALRDESTPKHFTPISSNITPLGKVLNMKF